MKSPIQTEESQRDHEHPPMVLDPLSLNIAVVKITAVFYIISILFLTLAPKATMTFFSYVSRPEFTRITKSMDWRIYMLGLLPFFLGMSTAIVMATQIHKYFKQK